MKEPAPARTIAASEQPRTMIILWILTLVFAALTFGLSAAASTAREWWVATLLSGFFALLGPLAIVGMAVKSFGVIKFGDVSLVLQDPLPIAGGRLRAQLRLPPNAAEARLLRARLICRRKRPLTDGYEDPVWQDVREFPITRDVATTIIIDLPAGLPDVYWHLLVTAQLPGKDFSRNFDIPVLPG